MASKCEASNTHGREEEGWKEGKEGREGRGGESRGREEKRKEISAWLPGRPWAAPLWSCQFSPLKIVTAASIFPRLL
jgi:hypothetical protein